MSMQFSYEITREGMAKMNAMRNIPKANKKILTAWLAGIVRLSKLNAAAMQKSGKGKKTSSMGRNVGMMVEDSGGILRGAVGTGVGQTQSVKYAAIQDKGGTTRPMVTDKLRRWAWAMFRETKDDKFKWIALTKKSHLTVNIPASKWFTGSIETSRPLLDEMLKPENVFRYALERMGGD